MAYHYYLRSAQRGHVDGAIAVAEMWNRGLPNQMRRLPEQAVLYVLHVRTTDIVYFQISIHLQPYSGKEIL